MRIRSSFHVALFGESEFSFQAHAHHGIKQVYLSEKIRANPLPDSKPEPCVGQISVHLYLLEGC